MLQKLKEGIGTRERQIKQLLVQSERAMSKGSPVRAAEFKEEAERLGVLNQADTDRMQHIEAEDREEAARLAMGLVEQSDLYRRVLTTQS